MLDRNILLVGGTLAAVVAAASLGAVAVQAQDAPKPEAAAPAPAEDWAALVKSLGDADFATREKAFARLREARASAKPALEEGAKSEDAQIRWSSKRLLRALEEPRGATPRRRLEFPAEDESGKSDTDEKGSVLFFTEEEIRRRMEEVRERIRALDKEFEELPARLPRVEISGNLFGPGGAGVSERHVVVVKDGEKTEVKVDAEGRVKVALTTTVDGKPKEEGFEAESVEALRKAHPDVYEKVKDLVGDGARIRVFAGNTSLPTIRLPRLEFRPSPQSRLQAALEPNKPVLGVTVSEVPEILRTHLAIGPDEGVVVEEVLEGTPAARLGFQRHDVILSVNGIPVSSAEDVRAAVGAVKEGGDLRIPILRAGRRTELAGTR